ncbi:MAG: hypothetical protein P4L59_10445 [Desulfosporosinus sp.]|nr:hypothetical protein [Desulfosporosinus sp.]
MVRRRLTDSLRDIHGWMERRSFMQTVTTLRHAWSNTASMQFQIGDDRMETAKTRLLRGSISIVKK